MSARRILLLALILACSGLQAHPYHSSFAEIGWSETGDALEVSLRVIPEDLETLLGWRAGRAVVLADSAAVRKMVGDWLADNFRVRVPGGEPLPLALVGLEAGPGESWLYFTVTAPRDQRLQLENRVLLEISENQANRVRRLWEEPGSSLLYNREHTLHPLWNPAS